MARDGQLQKPLNDPDGVKYINSKTQVGGADVAMQFISDASTYTGTV